MKFLVTLSILLFVTGCGSDFAQGLGVGVGASSAGTEIEKLSQQKKSALVAELAVVREKLKQAQDPDEFRQLREKLLALQQQQRLAETTELITDKVIEGLNRDWRTADPQKQESNIHWLIASAFGVLYGGNELRKRRAVERGVNKFQAENEPEQAKKLYEDIHRYQGRIIS